MQTPSNHEIADTLDRIADLLEAQHASPYRARAYRAGARSVRGIETPLASLVARHEKDELESLPKIGKSLAAVIRELVTSGRCRLLERLEGESRPQELFATIPGIGEKLAGRIEADLHIETLEDLELAVHDGRLASIPGFGPRRVRAIRDSLEHLLRFSGARRARAANAAQRDVVLPDVGVLLEMDRQYREGARRGELRRIAPRRFNPEHRAWLPVLHREIDGWSLTAMFSNTARAHELGRTADWVVVYFEYDGVDGQCTVVTERQGPQSGRRVIRGREAECSRFYESNPNSPNAAASVRGQRIGAKRDDQRP